MTTTRPRPDACHVRLAGELDIDTAPMLGAYLRTHTAAKPTYLLLDLCEVNFLAAAGLTVIVAAQRDDQSIHGDLRVIGVPSNRAIARVLRITGIDTFLRIHRPWPTHSTPSTRSPSSSGASRPWRRRAARCPQRVLIMATRRSVRSWI